MATTRPETRACCLNLNQLASTKSGAIQRDLCPKALAGSLGILLDWSIKLTGLQTLSTFTNNGPWASFTHAYHKSFFRLCDSS